LTKVSLITLWEPLFNSPDFKSGSHKVIKETFVKLKTKFGNRILSEISSADIERWLDRMPVGMRTKKRHRAYALQIFNAARKQKLVSSNPVEDVGYKGRKNDAEEITVVTPEQLQRLFDCAEPEILPLYAIATFAGVRWNEIEQLNWEDIKGSEIVISARIAKTLSRRIIPIRPALAAFLTERGDRIGTAPHLFCPASKRASAGLLASPGGKTSRVIPLAAQCVETFLHFLCTRDRSRRKSNRS
jgi:integrase